MARPTRFDAAYLKEQAILKPTNDIADAINSYVVSLLPGDEKQCLSCDKIVKGRSTHDSFDLLYLV